MFLSRKNDVVEDDYPMYREVMTIVPRSDDPLVLEADHLW
jgi:hypothetical protein